MRNPTKLGASLAPESPKITCKSQIFFDANRMAYGTVRNRTDRPGGGSLQLGSACGTRSKSLRKELVGHSAGRCLGLDHIPDDVETSKEKPLKKRGKTGLRRLYLLCFASFLGKKGSCFSGRTVKLSRGVMLH